MAVTASAKKTVGFKSPYIGDTFQELTELILGQDGYISGGKTSDDTVTITVEPFTIVQRGIMAQTLAATTGILVPTGPEPWFLLAAIPDDDPVTGVLLSVTTNLLTAADSVVVAFKVGGVWQNPVPVDVEGAANRATEPGQEDGFTLRTALDGSENITNFLINKGLLLDPDGSRRIPPSAAPESAQVLDVPTARAHVSFDRRDYLVLRQRESFSAEIKHLIGSMRGDESPLVLASGASVTRPHYFAKRAGTIAEQWWAWGDGTALRIQGGPAGEAFAATTVLTAASPIVETWVVGQRAADSAVIVIYLDGSLLRLVSFNAATGVKINTEITIDTQPNAIVRMRGFLDADEQLHVVYEHDEGGGPPSQQIYYAKFSVASATFGSPAVTPRIITVDGLPSGSNDTWPTFAVNRQGTVTVAHIRGVVSDEFGSLVVATIDSTGVPISQKTLLPGSDVGTTDPDDEEGRKGFSPQAFDDFRRTAVLYTDLDELHVFTLGTPTSSGEVDHILVHTPFFKERHGEELLSMSGTGLIATADYTGLAAVSAEQGHIFVASLIDVAGFRILASETLDVGFFRNGIHDDRSILDTDDVIGVTADVVGTDIAVARGGIGEMTHIYLRAISATTAARGAVTAGSTEIKTPSRHPKDVYLAQWDVPSDVAGNVNDENKLVNIFNTRPKKMNFPIVVGNEGDFHGFDSLLEALNIAGRLGGEVVLRPGYHTLDLGAVNLPGGISLRGEGSVIAARGSLSGNPVLRFGLGSGGAPTIVGNTIEAGGSLFANLKPGDLVHMSGAGGTGFHTVLKRFISTVAGTHKILVEDNISGAPVGTTAAPFYSGIVIENLTIFGSLTGGAQYHLHLEQCHQARVQNVRFAGDTTLTAGGVLGLTDCAECLVDNVDFTAMDSPDTANHLRVLGSLGGGGSRIRSASFVDGRRCQIAAAAPNIHLIGCHGDDSGPTLVVYDIVAGRTGPVFMVDCEGRASGDTDFLISNVGRRLRVGEFVGAMEFEDDNTRSGSIPDDGIKLSSGSDREFNGTSIDVITEAVNERIRNTGDTISGDLLGSGGPNLGDATTGRFNVLYVDGIEIVGLMNGDGTATIEGFDSIEANTISPSGVGGDLGGAAASARWDIFARTIDITPPDGVTHAILTNRVAGASHGVFRPEGRANTPNENLWGLDAFALPRARGLNVQEDFPFVAGALVDTAQIDVTTIGTGSVSIARPSIAELEVLGGGTGTASVETQQNFRARQGLVMAFRWRYTVQNLAAGQVAFVGIAGQIGFTVIGSSNSILIQGPSETAPTGLSSVVTLWCFCVLSVLDLDNVEWAIWTNAGDTFDYSQPGAPSGSGTHTLTVASIPDTQAQLQAEMSTSVALAETLEVDFMEAWQIDRTA